MKLKGKYQYLLGIVFLSTVIGSFLLFTAFQLFIDWKSISTQSDDYIIINKSVNILSSLGFKAAFSKKEIEDIGNLPFVYRTGSFESNQFRVNLSMQRLGFRTEAFLEAVPDEWIDIENKEDFKYVEGSRMVPIIVSADYLALYNFGFAPSQGLPQLSANTIGSVNFDLNIFGKGNFDSYKCKIVGFSKKLNSILVPKSFLDFANQKFGNQKGDISRLIVEVKENKTSDAIRYFDENGFEFQNRKAFGTEIAKLFNRVILLVVGIALLVLILSLLIFYLSYRLLIEENLDSIRIYFTQGYEPNDLMEFFFRYTIYIIGGSIITAIVLSQILHIYIYYQFLSTGLEINLILSIYTVLFSILFLIVILSINYLLIKKTLSHKYK